MANGSYTMAKFGPTYRDAPRIDYGPRVERIIQDARMKERWWFAQHLKLGRVILQIQRLSVSMSREAEPGQMAFEFGEAA